MKKLDYYLKLNYPVTIDKFEDYDGRVKYVAEIPELQGCSAHAEKLEEALKKLEDAKVSWLEISLSRNLEIPEPQIEDNFSGKFLLRIPAKLHQQLSVKASREALSLNQFVRFALEKYLERDFLASKLERLERILDSFCEKIFQLEVITESNKGTMTETYDRNNVHAASRWSVPSDKISASGKSFEIGEKKETTIYTTH